MTKKRTLDDYFGTKTRDASAEKRSRVQHVLVADAAPSSESSKRRDTSVQAEELAKRLNTKPTYLTENGDSWYLLVRCYLPPTDVDEYQKEWELHPTTRHKLKVYGKEVTENRWSQSWGVSYAYSGSTNIARPTIESTMVPKLISKVNALMQDLASNGESPYNGCLQNWYTPDDTIGLHSDDERSQRHDCPIFSLSWGGTRRFLLRERKDKNNKIEIFLSDGDLLVMGGTCQKTHYHEVPKLRKTMDPPTGNRINWTIRAFHESKNAPRQKK